MTTVGVLNCDMSKDLQGSLILRPNCFLIKNSSNLLTHATVCLQTLCGKGMLSMTNIR